MTERLLRVAVRVPPSEAEEARAAFVELAPRGFEERDAQDALELAAYVSGGAEAALRARFPDASVSVVAPGWEDAWRGFHRPVRVGRVWIGPPWERPDTDAVAVVIDPGRAFGTGAHPTTRLCVELLQSLSTGSLLDLGCGSGVLSVAAAKLGHEPVTALDVDPAAVAATRENAAANGVEVAVREADVLAGALPPAAVAVANIALPVVAALAQRVAAERLITAGYLAGERPALASWMEVERRELDGWAAHLFRRTSAPGRIGVGSGARTSRRAPLR